MPIIRVCKHCGTKNRVSADRLNDTARCGACKQTIPALSEPLSVDAPLFDEIVNNAKLPVLVDFWAEWCGPCRTAAPYVVRIAQTMAGRAIVVKVDTEKNPQLAARYQVRGIPNFAVFSAGKLVQQQAGLVDDVQMTRWLVAAGA